MANPELQAQQNGVSNPDDNQAELNIPRGKAYFWTFVICLAMILDMIDRTAVNAILPLLKKEFALSDAQAGFVGSVVGISMAVLVFPVAILCDQWSRRKMMSFMVGFWSLATYGTGIAQNYTHLILARLSVGTGEAGYAAPAFSLLSAWYPKSKRGLVLGVFNAAKPLGAAAGVAIAGYLAYEFGWRTMFGILAAPGILIAIMFWFIPDYKVKKGASDQTEKVPLKESILYLLRTKTILIVLLGGASVFIFENTFMIWGATYYARTFGMNVKEAGAVVGLIGLIACIGAPVFGALGDKLLKRSPKGRIYTAMTLAVFMFILMTAALKSGDFRTTAILWTAAMFILPGLQINVYAVTQDLVPPYLRGMSVSLVPIFNHLCFGVWAPMVAGRLSDLYGLPYALQMLAIASLVLCEIFFYLSLRYYMTDLDRVKALGTFKLGKG